MISEFNPFHDGHKYLIDEARKSGATHIVSIMSGNFVQRGDVAIYSKWDRAKTALCKGVDLCIEIPTCKCLSSAQNYAFSGVEIAESLGCVDKLYFGSESGNIDDLKKIVEILNSERFKTEFEKEYSKGVSFPVARQKSFENIGKNSLAGLLLNSNDILAVEYLNALGKLNSKIIPVCVKRLGAKHDSAEKNDTYQCASYIRNEIITGRIKPEYDIHLFKNLENAVFYKLMTSSEEELKHINDVDEGLENRIKYAANSSHNIEELFENIKTKRYTMSRIRRIILSILLDIKREEVYSKIPYIKVIGFNEKGKDILRKMKETSLLPVIMRRSDIKKLNDKSVTNYYEKECISTDIYSLSSAGCNNKLSEQKFSAFLFSDIDK